MLGMSVLAYAAWLPLIYVESFPSWKPPLSQLFWSSWNEGVMFAVALCAGGVRLLFFVHDIHIVSTEKMSTETVGLRSDSEAVLSRLFTPPSHINAVSLRLLSVLELPGKHFLGSSARPNLLDDLQDG